MYSIELFIKELIFYIIVISFVAIIVATIINILLLILKVTKLFYELKVWVTANSILLILWLMLTVPATLDIINTSFCEINNIQKIEVDFETSTRIDPMAGTHLLVVDEDGVTYTLYDFLIDTDSLSKVNYPGTVVYAKHSKLMLAYFETG